MKMFNMRKIVFLTAAAAGYAVFAANTWYVDAENGNDSWDGTADFENADPASNVGPKKTLGVFTSIVSEGDTIYVAPGYYTNGVSSASPNCRFYSSCGKISLISTGCATNTFICGAVDETVAQDEAPYGCGSAAILPVMMDGGGNVIKGITIANGRQTIFTNAGEANYGGGVRFVKYSSGWNNQMVDCVVTNCVANRGGGVFGAAYALRCRFTGNYAQEGAHAQYLHMAVNCIFENSKGYAVFNPSCVGTFLNCLCRGNERGGFRSTHGTDMTYVYNSVFVLDGKPASNTEDRGCNFVNCYFDYDPKDGKQVNIAPAMQTDAACRFFSSGSLRFTADGLPMSRNPVIGAAKESYYNDYFPGNVESFGRGYDLMGEVRNSGSGMEIGAVEHVHGRAYPNDWYVDAENGDDANSGNAPDLAKKTLVAIMDGRAAGDVVHAAPGVYSNGTVTVDSQEYRVKIPKGVSLVATEGAESTVILGEASAEPDGKYGTGPGAVSCVHMSETDMDSQAGVYGFTLSCGHSASKSGIYGSAVRGAEGTAGIVADCLITNCVAGRGPVYLVGGVVRCRFLYNVSTEGAGGSVYNVNCVCDSYFKNSISGYNDKYFPDVYHNANPGPRNGFVLNCTFDSDGNGGPHAAGTSIMYVYNSIVRTSSDEGGSRYYNSVVTIGNIDSSNARSEIAEGTVHTNRSSVALTEESYRPVAGFNPAVGAGDYCYYTNLLPAAVAAVAGKDLWGNPRLVNGVLDVGAVASGGVAVKASDPSTAFDVVGLEEDGLWHDVEPGTVYSLSRNFTTPKLLRGFYLNDEYVDFNAHEDGWVYTGTVPAFGALEIVPDYSNCWYVDAVFGDDGNKGQRPGAGYAFKTLARASTNEFLEAGDTVYVAEGIYDTGVVPASFGIDSTDCRMMVPENVHFVASGARAETIVEGASSQDTECGIGNGAVRCCLVKGGSVRGFTMRYGNVNASSVSDENDQGGGIRFAGDGAFAYDCEIYGCNAVRGGGASGGPLSGISGWSASLIRCYLHDNSNNTAGVKVEDASGAEVPRNTAGTGCYYCSGYNTVVEGDCYWGEKWLNCTITGKCWGGGTAFYNSYIGVDNSSDRTPAAFTNCVTSGAFRDHSLHANCQEGKTYTYNKYKSWRPRTTRSALFNAGDNSLYAANFPEELAEYAGFDYAGGVRILEGVIDVGAGEMIYDPIGMHFILR